MADSKTYAPHPGVKRIAASNPVAGEGRQREKRCNSTSGEIFTHVGGSVWKGTQGNAVAPITAANHPDLTSLHTMDEISGNTLIDSSTAGNHASITGAVSVAGKSGNALDFSQAAETDYVTLPYRPFGDTGTSNAALCFWVKADSVVLGSKLFAHRSSANDLVQLEFDTTDRLALQVRSSGTGLTETQSSVLDFTTDYLFVVFNYDWASKRFEVFVNDISVLVDVTAYSGSITSAAFLLGAYYDGTVFAGGMDAKLDQFRAFNRVLTAAERTALYNGGVGV